MTNKLKTLNQPQQLTLLESMADIRNKMHELGIKDDDLIEDVIFTCSTRTFDERCNSYIKQSYYFDPNKKTRDLYFTARSIQMTLEDRWKTI